MHSAIRQRSQIVFQAIQEKSAQRIQAIASAAAIPISSAHRHQQTIIRRNQHPELAWWETEAGSAWLKLLVCGVIFFFGLKHGIGEGELSQFLKALQLGLHVGCSPSSLERLKQPMTTAIEAYEAN